jgi:Ca-activated chloride channel family protein
MLEFGYPWLFLLLIAPLFFHRKNLVAAGQALHFKALARAAAQQQQTPLRSKKITLRNSALLLIWIALITSAAQPRWLGEPQHVPLEGRDMMLAVDLSASMNINDMISEGQNFNRLDTVKRVLREFIINRKGDRLGLILFADAAYQQTPLTFDLLTVQQMLDEAVHGLVGQRTSIGEAVGLAVKRFNTYESSNKVLILLSDGANTSGQIQPLEALELAKAAGVKIYTVGVGAEELLQQGIFGPQMINPSSDLDEQLLTNLATSTGGRYFRARDPKELAQIYQLLDQLEPIARDPQTFRPQQSLLHWPLSFALFMLCLITVPQFIRGRNAR